MLKASMACIIPLGTEPFTATGRISSTEPAAAFQSPSRLALTSRTAPGARANPRSFSTGTTGHAAPPTSVASPSARGSRSSVSVPTGTRASSSSPTRAKTSRHAGKLSSAPTAVRSPGGNAKVARSAPAPGASGPSATPAFSQRSAPNDASTTRPRGASASPSPSPAPASPAVWTEHASATGK